MTPLDRLWRQACHLLLLALVAAAGCSRRDAQKQQSDPRPTVLTSFTVLADLARNVAGDRLQVRSIVKPGAEIHGYQPTPSDIERASSADLIIENGLGLELWFRRFTAAAGDVPTLTLSEGMQPLLITEDAYAGKPNPHAWMSPSAPCTTWISMNAFSDLILPALHSSKPMPLHTRLSSSSWIRNCAMPSPPFLPSVVCW